VFGRGSAPHFKKIVGVYVLLRFAFGLREIVNGEGLRKYVMNIVMPYVKMLPMVKRELAKSQADVRKSLEPELFKTDLAKFDRLPKSGMLDSELLDMMTKRAKIDAGGYADGKITGAVYHGGHEHCSLMGRIMGMFAYTNPLHPALHPATRQMDAEVVRMVLNMYNGDENTCGNFTTGGTESILCALKTYRDWGRETKGIRKPNIVACVTAHAAFDKGCQYFGIQLRHARADTKTQRVDVAHLESLMDANTVAIVGSACAFPAGNIDRIDELSRIALRRGVGLHVDCCLGGFIVPFMEKAGFPVPHFFDFRLKGVTTISCDPHKYGFAPKGSSVLMFRNKELRHHMYAYIVNWTGGIYATSAMTGSRAGGVVAGAWASMVRIGESGYVDSTREIVSAVRAIAKGIEEDIDGIDVFGSPDACVVAFTGSPGSGVNCYSVADCMKQKHDWELATLQNPPAIHLAMTKLTARNATQFLKDLKEAVAIVRADTEGKFNSTAGMYGMAAKLPSQLIEESVKVYLDTCMATKRSEAA